jgi:hypothetical protein
MKVWGPLEGSKHRKRKRDGSRPCPALQHFDHLLLSACRLACGVVCCAARLAGLGTRVSLLQCFWSSVKCDLARLRYSAHLQASLQRPGDHYCPNFRTAAHANLPPVHPWPTRVGRASLLLPESISSAPSLSRYLCCHVSSQASIAWERALASYPAASDNVSAPGRRCGSGLPVHLDPLR